MYFGVPPFAAKLLDDDVALRLAHQHAGAMETLLDAHHQTQIG
jgi:hypothetical protein